MTSTTLCRHNAAHLARRAISYCSNTEEACRQQEPEPGLMLNVGKTATPTVGSSVKDQKHLQGTETTEWTHRANILHRQLPTVKLHQQLVSRLLGETFQKMKILFNMSDRHGTSKASRDTQSCLSAFQSQGQEQRQSEVWDTVRHRWDCRTNGWRTCQTGSLTD